MRKTFLFGAALALTVALAGFSRAEQGAQDNVSTFRLDNGMDIVVIEDHRAPVVVHMVWYRAGSADESPGVSGVAHFLEHLLFKATENMEAGELSATVAENGGTDNAFTSRDQTAYFQRVAADRLELMMRMEADRMRNLRLTEEDIATERDVVLEERNMRVENNPGALFSEQRGAAQYLNHPYGRPVIGWKHEVEKLTRADALEFYRRYYAPNNAILIVSGDADPAEVLEMAKRHYGPLAPTPGLGPRMRPQEPPQTAARRLTYRDPRVAQPYVTRSYLAPERDPGAQRKAAALTLLAEVLGGNPTTSYLARRLQFEQPIAIYTASFYDGTSLDDTSFNLTVVPKAGITLEEAEAALDQALAGFLEEGVDEGELRRVKMQMKAALIYERDNVQSTAQRYGQALTSGLAVEDVQAWPGILQAVTEEEIMAVAREVLDRRRSVTGWLMQPEPAGENAAAQEEPSQ